MKNQGQKRKVVNFAPIGAFLLQSGRVLTISRIYDKNAVDRFTFYLLSRLSRLSRFFKGFLTRTKKYTISIKRRDKRDKQDKSI
jgi:hypothetical protein